MRLVCQYGGWKRRDMPGKVFISYRRDDVPGDARGIRDALAKRFGKSSVFMDVNNLFPGERFDEEIAKALAASDVLIAIIGPRWMDLLKAKAASGEPDYVCKEISQALKRRITVIPVRVGREGKMPPVPAPVDLPRDIRDLSFHHKHDVAQERFGRDVDELVLVLRRWLGSPMHKWRAIGVAAVLAIVGTVIYLEGPPIHWPVSTVPSAPTLVMEALPGSGQSFRDTLANGQPCPWCPELVIVPSGWFMMGSPEMEEGHFSKWDKNPDFRQTAEDQTPVNIPAPFAVGKFAVTRGEFAAFVEDAKSKLERGCFTGMNRQLEAGKWWQSPGFMQSDRHPVVCVNWDDAAAYIAWLSRKTGKAYRLLSDAEREYVTRAGRTTPFWWGSSISPAQANYDATSSYGGGPVGEWRKQPLAVDGFDANPWGLYSVHGNVWEWTADCWNEKNAGNPGNGSARTSGNCSLRVVRGGSWIDLPRSLRAAHRDWGTALNRDYSRGFRLARALTP